jgi:hypothetical protein
MTFSVRTMCWSLLCCVALLGLVGLPSRLGAPTALAQDACPPGTDPAGTVSLGQMVLSQGAPPYATVMLTRITLQPGESLDPISTHPTIFYVESGVLQYPFQPWLSIMAAPACVPEDGPFTMGGTTTVDAGGMVTVSQGQALIAESGVTGPIANGGATPLVILEMTVIAPELDPVSGLPIVDPATAGRERAKAFEERKQACKAETRQAKRRSAMGTPATDSRPDESLTGPIATPAVATSGWATDVRHEPRTIPRACQEP